MHYPFYMEIYVRCNHYFQRLRRRFLSSMIISRIARSRFSVRVLHSTWKLTLRSAACRSASRLAAYDSASRLASSRSAAASFAANRSSLTFRNTSFTSLILFSCKHLLISFNLMSRKGFILAFSSSKLYPLSLQISCKVSQIPSVVLMMYCKDVSVLAASWLSSIGDCAISPLLLFFLV